jgi:hypothetical protein
MTLALSLWVLIQTGLTERSILERNKELQEITYSQICCCPDFIPKKKKKSCEVNVVLAFSQFVINVQILIRSKPVQNKV